MPDFRVYCVPTDAAARELVLDPDESHHLVVTNRCRRGDPVVAFDGAGREWWCECVDPARAGARLIVRSTRLAPPRDCAVTLAQALPKGGVMDEIVRQATEIGAARIVPLATARSQVHLDDDRAVRKVAKWRVTAIEAAKQCGNPWLPAIAPVTPLAEFLAGPGTELRLVASLHAGARPLRRLLAERAARSVPLPQNATWLVGPEGDLSTEEMTAALSAGFQPVTLGPLVLRSDTAACCALAILLHELRPP